MSRIQSGTVTSNEITTNNDSEDNVRMLEVQISDPDDVQSVQLFSPSGDDSNPPVGSTVAIINVSQAYKVVVAANDNIEPSMDVGEKKLYSSANGSIMAFINLKNDGDIELQSSGGATAKLLNNGDIELESSGGATTKLLNDGNVEVNGNTDNAVAFNDLKTGFDLLVTELNTFISQYNLHTHNAIVGTPILFPGVPAIADVDASEISTIKVP